MPPSHFEHDFPELQILCMMAATTREDQVAETEEGERSGFGDLGKVDNNGGGVEVVEVEETAVC